MSNNFSTEVALIAAKQAKIDVPSKKGNWGISLSGGGIRSATFSLGMLQAISEKDKEGNASGKKKTYKKSMLSYFDYLSTVSGGGYIGGFLSSLFLGERHKGKCEDVCKDINGSSEVQDPELWADHAIRVLSSGIPSRAVDITASPDLPEPIPPEPTESGTASVTTHSPNPDKFPLAWLRNNGRYLLPSGTGDLTYAVSIVLRNFISLHYMIGIVLLTTFLILVNIRDFFITICLCLSIIVVIMIAGYWMTANFKANKEIRYYFMKYFFISSVFVAFSVLVFSVSYFFCSIFNEICHTLDLADIFDFNKVFSTLQILINERIAHVIDPENIHKFFKPDDSGENTVVNLKDYYILMLYLVLFVIASAFVYTLTVWAFCYGEDQVSLMRRRITGHLSLWALGLFVSLCVFGIDYFVNYLIDEKVLNLPKILPLMGGAIAYIAKILSEKGDALIKHRGVFIKVLSIAGIVCLAVIWYYIARVIHDCIFSSGEIDLYVECGRYWFLVSVLVFAIFIAGYHTQFINLSSLQTFYTAKLIRAYLGASNSKRITGDANKNGKECSVSEPVVGDDFCMCSLSSTLAPFHIVNVTVNQTAGVIANDGSTKGDDSIVLRDRKGRPLAITCCGNYLEGKAIDGVEKLTFGEWLGISGAAFSTAIGRQTSLSSSLLMGLANVRLGYWYNAREDKIKIFNFFKNNAYRYLRSELFADFHGARRDYFYLTDGGHYENTGIYELLRSERKVKFILGCDNGADPDYQFDDLANLIRLAKIDLNVVIEVHEDFSGFEYLGSVFGGLNQFCKSSDFNNLSPQPSALLLKAKNFNSLEETVTWIALIKPRYSRDVSIDVWNYVKCNKDFPQEVTADQFFDEAQWESYRALGYLQCKKVLDPLVWKELRELCDI